MLFRSVSDLFDSLIQSIQKNDVVNIFTFKQDCIFFENGVIDMSYNEDGKIDYQFISHKEMSLNQCMFQYATNM